MKKAKRTIKAKKATKQNKYIAIAMQPVAFVAALASKLATYFK